MSDYLPLGHLAKLLVMSDPILEATYGFSAASKGYDKSYFSYSILDIHVRVNGI
jgi:hypothetical protein